ncbi:MAG: aldo/keto reductase [Actinobacteria bacterium]|nr:aldo/keto reductase [Actinomycetota bacterium]
MRTVKLPSGERIPVLGQGTWHLAEVAARRDTEIFALRRGLDLGMTVIDTAEMYADGEAEILVGEAIAGRRDEVFLVSKVLPQHATAWGTVAACEASLRRLGTDRIDLYLLHWRGGVPLADTVRAFGSLQQAGLIRYWGVSNFDTPDMKELTALPGGAEVATDQVLYNLSRRGPELNLFPLLRELHVPIMAYSPIEQGRILRHPVLGEIAERHHATPAQIALAWVLRRDDVCAIPRASRPEHTNENRAAADIQLDRADLSQLDRDFPRPDRVRPLEML